VGAWSDPPAHWSDEVVDRLSSGPLVAQVRAGISELPEGQRAVVTLRDLDGLSSKDVCDVLGISQANQRYCCTAAVAGYEPFSNSNWRSDEAAHAPQGRRVPTGG